MRYDRVSKWRSTEFPEIKKRNKIDYSRLVIYYDDEIWPVFIRFHILNFFNPFTKRNVLKCREFVPLTIRVWESQANNFRLLSCFWRSKTLSQ